MNKHIKILFIIALFILSLSFICCKNNNDAPDKPAENDNKPDEKEEIVIELKDNLEKVFVGETAQINYTSNKDITIESSNPEVLKIDGNNMTGLKEGKAKVTLSKDEKSVYFDVEVIEVMLSAPNYSIVKMADGASLSNLFTSSYPIDSYEYNDTELSILSDTLVPLKIGSFEIKAKISRNNFSKEVETTIIAIQNDNDVLLVSGIKDTLDLGGKLELTVSSMIPDDEIIYELDNSDILKLENNILTAIGTGTAVLTITSAINNASLIYTITVTYEWPVDTVATEGVYLGLYDYGNVTNSQMSSFKYKFSIDGTVQTYTMTKVGSWELQNKLEEGNIYHLIISGSNITDLVKCDDQEAFAYIKKSSLVEGKVEAITAFDITVNNETYSFLESTTLYEISKFPGGARVYKREIKVGDNVIISLTEKGYAQNVYKSKQTPKYTPVVEAVPGLRTLTNFFKTALSAVGHALYVYGGAWNYEDDGSSNQARTIGVADSWVEFFYEQDAYYSYRDNSNHSASYYPFGSFNEYYYAGVDCSGFVGWVIYNILNTESGQPGYVQGSTKMAQTFANMGMGTYKHDYSLSDFKVGDIVSTDGHVWICLGVCSDDSMVIIHSTPSESIYGYSGGGAQIGAIGSSTSCEAYKLAEEYNQKYYPDWYQRYHTSLKSYSSYTARSKAAAGKFSWNLDSTGVLDPDGLSTLEPSQILKILFGEALLPTE